MVYGYIRVSTDKQTVENQRFEIKQFALKDRIIIDRWIEETISGTIAPKKRNLGKLLSHIQKDDVIICSELSRLGRSMFMIMSILNRLMETVLDDPSQNTEEKLSEIALNMFKEMNRI